MAACCKTGRDDDNPLSYVSPGITCLLEPAARKDGNVNAANSLDVRVTTAGGEPLVGDFRSVEDVAGLRRRVAKTYIVDPACVQLLGSDGSVLHNDDLLLADMAQYLDRSSQKLFGAPLAPAVDTSTNSDIAAVSKPRRGNIFAEQKEREVFENHASERCLDITAVMLQPFDPLCGPIRISGRCEGSVSQRGC